jgi:DNA polymerase
VYPDMDFETASEAGYTWDDGAERWRPLLGATKGGLPAVGAAKYAEHPSTRVLSLAYDLKDGLGERLWLPGMTPPTDLFDHLGAGGLIEAWNCGFEYHIWRCVCHERMGWPMIDFRNMRDAMAKARAFSLPAALGKAAEVTGAAVQKMEEGKRLIKKFSCPRHPTKRDARTWHRPEDFLEDAALLYEYNIGDIKTEAAVSALIPELPDNELEFWINTQACNYRGVGVRPVEVEACISILEQAYHRYNAELRELTGGSVKEASKVQQLLGWMKHCEGYEMANLDDAAITRALKDRTCPPTVRRVLEIRQMIGSAGVKKVYAMARRVTRDNRLCDLFNYHGARTGRDTGSDVQPQNLVKAGPKLYRCTADRCDHIYGTGLDTCPQCGASSALFGKPISWTWEAVDDTIEAIKTKNLDHVESIYGNAVLAVSGCIRGLFTPAPGKEFICSDYSSIEAVVAAVLAGEQWRIEAFNRKQDIYLTSCAMVTGKSYDWYMENGGKKHPDRQKIGKPAELGLGYGGFLNAWRQFDKTDTFSDAEVKDTIMKWREASPAIVEMWGGQVRGKPWAPDYQEYYGLEGAAIMAIMNQGQAFSYRSISYQVHNDVLYCRLPSGRCLVYHQPRLSPSDRWEGQVSISYMGYNSNPQMGKIGWVRIDTFGGRLFENVDQAVSRDIMAHATNLAERRGYPIVLRVHDELVAEVPEGYGSIEEFEQIMGALPDWAAGWPVRAAGGWRGTRYRKD